MVSVFGRWLAVFFLLSLVVAPGGAGPLTGVKIAIDPGHGGQAGQTYSGVNGDPGAVGLGGLREADCVLSIGLRLRDLLQAQGATVYLTRDRDVSVSLPGRTNLANSLGVDRLISLHQNANANRTPNYTGSHVHTSASQNSIDLAAKSVAELEAYHKIGVVSSNLSPAVRGVRADNFHMVRESVMPAQLVENTFISNVDEETRLRNVAHLHAAADAIFRGVLTHLGKTIPTDAVGPTIAHSAMTQAQEASALTLAATITDASGVQSATLTFRKRGAALWTSQAMTRGAGEVWSATISASLVTAADGLEYYIQAKDALGNVSSHPSGSPVAPIQVTVASLPKTGSLTGVITDAATGARLGGVAVIASPSGRQVTTSATGVYRFDDLQAGQYTVTGKLSGYADNATAKAVEAGSLWWNSFALSPLPRAPQPGDVVITELMWDALEYVELHNRTTRDISIAGWRITAGSGSDTDRVQVIIDNNAVLRAGGYYVAADSGALKGLTVDEIDAQSWAQTSQVVTVWTGKSTDPTVRIIDRIGRLGGAWFGGVNDAAGVAMERKSPTLAGTEPGSWQTSSGLVGGRKGTAGAASSAGRIVTAFLESVGGAAVSVAGPGGNGLSAFLVQALLAAGTYDSGPELRVAIEGPAQVSAGSRHTYTAIAYEGEKQVGAPQSFTVTFGNGPSATVSRALTVTVSTGKRESISGHLQVAVERQAGTVMLEVNNPATGASDIEAGLASIIRSATSSVKVAIYALDSRLVIDALKAAAANLGAENVQIVMEGANYANATYGPLARELEAAGITIIRDDQFGTSDDALMHHKFVVLDDRTVWVGSANMTGKDAYQNANNVLIFRSPDLAAAYAAEFDRMFAGRFSRAKTEPIAVAASIRPPSDLVDINRARASSLEKLPGLTPAIAQAIVDERNRNGAFVVVEDILRVPAIDAAIFNGLRSRITVDAEATITTVEALFSPHPAIKDRIVEAINGAQTEIAFAIFTFTDPDIAAALKRAQARGVRVRGVADAWQALAEVSQVSGLRDAGLDVKKDGGNGLMHNKFIVIDGTQVLTGSVNWTYSAVQRNDESLLVLKSGSLARKYLAAFEGYYAAGR